MSAQSYIEYIFLDYLYSQEFDKLYCDRWIPSKDMDEAFKKSYFASFESYGVIPPNADVDLIENIKSQFIENNVLQSAGDQYTGEHRRLPRVNKDDFVSRLRDLNEVKSTIDKLGADALASAISRIASERGWNDTPVVDTSASDNSVPDRTAPAADRIVSLSHNQVSEYEERASEIIASVEQLNVIEGEVGLREVILGQLKAGRELIRTGLFKVFVLEVTLLNALGFLAQRYEKEVIGALAAALMAELLNAFGGVS